MADSSRLRGEGEDALVGRRVAPGVGFVRASGPLELLIGNARLMPVYFEGPLLR
jgi:hypothetical protein